MATNPCTPTRRSSFFRELAPNAQGIIWIEGSAEGDGRVRIGSIDSVNSVPHIIKHWRDDLLRDNYQTGTKGKYQTKAAENKVVPTYIGWSLRF